MLAIVLGQRIPHISKAGSVISKMPISVEGKKVFIYIQSAITDGPTLYDDLQTGQTIVVDRDGQFYKFAESQEVAQGGGTQEEQVTQIFHGTVIPEATTTGDDVLKGTKLMANCILGMRGELPQEFSSEDCRCAGISLFIQFTKNKP